MKTQTTKMEFFVAGLLVGLIVFSRLTAHVWNFTAVGGVALFAGAYFNKKFMSMGILLLGLLISDSILGFHNQMLAVYFSYGLIAAVGYSLDVRGPRLRTILLSLTGGALFYLITNFSVWLSGELYPLTTAGLIECYVMGIPFFRPQIIADVIFSVALFEIAKSPATASLAIRLKLESPRT